MGEGEVTLLQQKVRMHNADHVGRHATRERRLHEAVRMIKFADRAMAAAVGDARRNVWRQRGEREEGVDVGLSNRASC